MSTATFMTTITITTLMVLTAPRARGVNILRQRRRQSSGSFARGTRGSGYERNALLRNVLTMGDKTTDSMAVGEVSEEAGAETEY